MLILGLYYFPNDLTKHPLWILYIPVPLIQSVEVYAPGPGQSPFSDGLIRDFIDGHPKFLDVDKRLDFYKLYAPGPGAWYIFFGS